MENENGTPKNDDGAMMMIPYSLMIPYWRLHMPRISRQFVKTRRPAPDNDDDNDDDSVFTDDPILAAAYAADMEMIRQNLSSPNNDDDKDNAINIHGHILK